MNSSTVLFSFTLMLTVLWASPLNAGGRFVPLFNGKDLTGWTPSEENPDSFSVEDGVLVAKGGRSHLFYTGEVNDGEFQDFEVKARVMTTPGSNGGFYFHSTYQDEGWPKQGYEAQVNSTHKDPRKTGSLYGISDIIVLADGDELPKNTRIEVRDEAPSTDGEWFNYYIKVQGKRIIIKVNGETTVDYVEPEGGPDPKFGGRRLSSGTFALQAHDPKSETRYQSIEVRVLDQ